MRMRSWVMAAAVAAGAMLSGCASVTPVAERADALMRELVQRNRFQGAVVMGRSGRIEYAVGFGHADLERRLPFTPDTQTDGASMAKTFTAAALLMLVAEGRIELETPVRSVLPEYPHARTRVRHLLAHSAGLFDYEWLDSRVAAEVPRTNQSHLALVARDAPVPQFEPGSAFMYDNVAYDVAALVVERVASSSYSAVVAERFFRPLNLSAFVRPARFGDWPGPRTRGYRRAADGWKDHDAHDLEGFHGGANIYLSARDLYRWVSGYAGVVGVATNSLAVAPSRLDDGRATGISMGSWYVAANGTKRYYTGSHNGFFSFGYFDEARDLAIAWVANDAPPPWLQTSLSRALIAIAEGRAPEPLIEPPATAPVVDPSGTYRVSEVGDVAVRREGRLLAVRLGGVAYQGFPVARGVHYVPGLDAYLRFQAAPQGQVALSWTSVFLSVPSTVRSESSVEP